MGFDLSLRRYHKATVQGLGVTSYETVEEHESIVVKEEKGLGAHQKKTFEFEL